jgi:putative hydrolase of the HAD superfamily
LSIIFDLDDTLIDTSGVVTPYKMQLCVAHWLALGYQMGDAATAYQVLMDCNHNAVSSRAAIEQCARDWNIAPKDVEAALHLMTAPMPPHFVVLPTPGAFEVVRQLGADRPLALVTGGYPPFQREKMEKAGLDTTIFSMIAIPEDSQKGDAYKAFQKKIGVPSEQMWVCGDRITMDLWPAHQLGFRTVHMRWGRGLREPRVPWVTYEINELRQFQQIIRNR